MVTALVGQLGAKGIGDLMYSNPMYIDEYIRLNHGGITEENDKAAYDKLYEELKDEDLTEEFTSHLLGTEEKPGMLRNTHTAAFRPYIPNNSSSGKYHDTSYGSVSKIRASKFIDKINSHAQVVMDLQGITWDKTSDGNYKSRIKDKNDKHVFRERWEMIEQMEMDSFYPDVYSNILGSVYNPEEDEDIVAKGTKDDPITLEEGETPESGKYYVVRKPNSNVYATRFYDGTTYINK